MIRFLIINVILKTLDIQTVTINYYPSETKIITMFKKSVFIVNREIKECRFQKWGVSDNSWEDAVHKLCWSHENFSKCGVIERYSFPMELM